MAHIERKEYGDYSVFVHIMGEKYVIQFNADWIDEEHKEWLCMVLGAQLDDLVDKVQKDTKKEIVDNLHKALFIGESQ